MSRLYGVSHPILTNEREEDIEYEIAVSKRIIEQKIGKPVLAFAYPDGTFNEFVKRKLEKNGYSCAFSTIPGINNERTDRLEIRRIGFFDGPLYIFGVKMACFPWIARRMARERMMKNGNSPCNILCKYTRSSDSRPSYTRN